MSRSADEQKSLHLARLRQWAHTATTTAQRVAELRAEADRLQEHVTYAMLEAREERESLIALGVTDAEINVIVKLPPMPKAQREMLAKTARAGAQVTTRGVVRDDRDADIDQRGSGADADNGHG